MIRIWIIISFSLILTSGLLAQKEGNIWYFGQYAGIDFNGDEPVALTNSSMDQDEGCASICDPDGNLLFYTDGMTVWNRHHNIMQNGTGLMGGISSSQSGIIVPKPGDPAIYYVFSVPAEIGYDGLRYSVIGLTLAGGLGAVTSEKNKFLISPTMEKVTGVRHGNGKDIWVITHLWNSDAFYAYLINEEGINTNPVISHVGATHSSPNNHTHGYMKVSPDGKKLVITNRILQSFELFDFDSNSGIVSNALLFPGDYNYVYGLEFSPDCSKLYVGKYSEGSRIYQFDLMAGTPQDIFASKYIVGGVSNSHLGALQLAPDHRIYMSKNDNLVGDAYLGVINFPNEPRSDCNYIEDGFYLKGRKCIWGLPNFLQNYFIADFTYDNVCLGDTTFFRIGNTNSIVSVEWNFGDPASGNQNTSTLLNPWHIYSAPGNYQVTLSVEYPYNDYEVSHEVLVYAVPEVDLGSDTAICNEQSFLLSPGNNFVTYLWQDGSQEPEYLVTETGLYWVEVSNEFGCTSRDSIMVSLAPGPEVSLGADSTLCEGDTVVMCAEGGYQQYLWQDGSSDSCFTAYESGNYWVEVTDENGCTSGDTISLAFLPGPEIALGNDTLVCFNEVLILNAGAGYVSYLWQDGSSGQSLVVTQPGTYWVQVSNQCGSGSDTIQVSFSEAYDISLGNDTSFCYGNTVILDPGAGYQSYLWQNGSTAQTMVAATTGTYWVEVSDSLGCIAKDTVFIEAYMDFEISIGEDTVRICQGDYVFLTGPEGYADYLWQDGSGFPTLLADTAGTYWLEVTDENGCAARDSMELIVHVIPKNLLGSDTIICPGEELNLQALTGYETYVWHDGSGGNSFTTGHAGKFWVTVQDEIGCTGSDTILVSDFDIPALGMAGEELICRGDSLLLDAGEGHLSYFWQDGSQQPQLLVTGEGLYWVEIETICGMYADSVQVNFYEGDLDLGRDTTLCDGEMLRLYPGAGYSDYFWSNGSTDSSIFIGGSGTYWLEAFDGFCLVSDTIHVDACAQIWIPNVFTPNGDGYNDRFYADTENPGGIVNFRMVIFNRWGRIVYTMDHINDKWDGRINNTDASDGVYFWVCDYSAVDKHGKINNHSRQGSVTLIR